MIAVRYGNWLYFTLIFLMLGATILLLWLTKKKGKRWADRFVFYMLWINFALHFLKQLNPYYMAEFPFSLTRSSPENLCAVLVIAAPLVYCFGNAYAKDYLYYIGFLSGWLVFFTPTTAIGRDLGNLENAIEVFRFYSCHAPLILGGLMMVASGNHKLDYRRLWAIPFAFVLVELVIVINAIFMQLVNIPGWATSWQRLISRDYFVNQSLSFGPPPGMDKVGNAWFYYLYMATLTCFPLGNGEWFFLPAVWIGPAIAFGTMIAGIPLCYYWERRHLQEDFEAFLQKARMRKAVKRR